MYLNSSVGKGQYPVRVHDGVEPVGDGEDGAVLEAASDRLLNQGIGPEIHYSFIYSVKIIK